jgi:hypothetical protein
VGVIGEGGKGKHINGKAGSQELQTILDPLASMSIVAPRNGIFPGQEGASDAALGNMKDVDLIGWADFGSGGPWHESGSLEARNPRASHGWILRASP